MSESIEVNHRLINGSFGSAEGPLDLDMFTAASLAPPQERPFHDQVYALIFNEDNEALILEAPPRGQGWPEWQLVTESLPTDDDPLPFAKRKLLEVAGYVSNEWIYLGSYRLGKDEAGGAGHFFCARKACAVPAVTPSRALRWVKAHELRHGLIDGRVSSLNIAVTISLGLLLS